MLGDITPEIGEKLTEVFNLIGQEKGLPFIIDALDDLLAENNFDRNRKGFESLAAEAMRIFTKEHPLHPHLGQFYIVANSAIENRNHAESRKFVRDYRSTLKRRLN